MPRKSLKTASQSRARTSAKQVANKAPKSNNSTTQAKPTQSTTATTSNKNDSVINVPGLVAISPDKIVGMLPKFDADSYNITDPLNPPENAPQITEVQFDKGKTINEGMQRALKLTGMSFDTTRERFTTMGKQAKAFGAGVLAATEFERVRGNYFDYLNQLETNEQKSIVLNVSQYKTVTDQSKAVYDKTVIAENLKQSEIAAEKAQEATKQKQSELEEFKKRLGQYAKA
jgi:hypothetical protein